MKITPSQAVLILIKKYQASSKDKSGRAAPAESASKLQQLKELYIRGAQTPSERIQLNDLLKDEVLSTYEISYDYNFINSDPSRRYFESHLSFETAKAHFRSLSLEDLTKHRDFIRKQTADDRYKPEEKEALEGRFDEKSFTSVSAKEKAKKEGKEKTATPDFGPAEFGDAINAIQSSPFYKANFNQEDREKLIRMMQCCYLAVINVTAHNDTLPFSDIAKKAPYDAVSRGRQLKTDSDITQLDVRTNVVGLMKGTMPISRGDILYREEGFKYLKPADRCVFDEKAAFIRTIFESALNTFSCSISGTTLCQVKMLAKAANDGALQFNDENKLKDFFRGFISAVQFNAGGHTMIEFCSVLALPEIQTFFKNKVPGFEKIDVSTLFLHGNEAAFEQALTDAIEYNDVVLKKNVMQNELNQYFDTKQQQPIESIAIADLNESVAVTVPNIDLSEIDGSPAIAIDKPELLATAVAKQDIDPQQPSAQASADIKERLRDIKGGDKPLVSPVPLKP